MTTTKRLAVLHLYRDAQKNWRWRLKAANGAGYARNAELVDEP